MVLRRSQKNLHKNKSEYSIQSIENAIDVLEQFMSNTSELGVTEISKNLNLHKNNIFRILATLENRGYIEQNLNNEHYKLGIKNLELGNYFLMHNGLTTIAGPLLEELTEEIEENSYLGMLKSNRIFYVQHAQSNQVLRVSSRVGRRLSPLCTAIGKVILAYYNDTDRDKVIEANEFIQHTPKTITSKDQFIKELEKIKLQGYAIDDEELDHGVTCISSPIFNYNREIIAGVSISGPITRVNQETMEKSYIPKVVEYAKKISRAIGYTGN